MAKQGSRKKFDAESLELVENELCTRYADRFAHSQKRKALSDRYDPSKRNAPKENPDNAKEEDE